MGDAASLAFALFLVDGAGPCACHAHAAPRAALALDEPRASQQGDARAPLVALVPPRGDERWRRSWSPPGVMLVVLVSVFVVLVWGGRCY